jgi:hypothetical protein
VVEVEEEEEVVVGAAVAVAVEVVAGVAPVPRTEIRVRVLVDRRPELARLELVVHTAHWSQQVQSPRTLSETRKNETIFFCALRT